MIRRDFFKYSFLASSFLFPMHSFSMTQKKSLLKRTKIVICGAGFGGLSTAKYLKELNPLLDITVIEKNKSFVSCPLSNAFLGGVEGFSYDFLSFDYQSAVKKYQYNFINEEILDIKRDIKRVITSTKIVEYDYLVMSLGVDYNYKKLFKRDKEKAKEALLKAPPGLKSGREHLQLKSMIDNFKGGNFILTIPSQQYKCPSAPYERACMIAHYFKNNNIKGKVIIIDPRVKPASKPDVFIKAYTDIYSEYIEYRNLTNFKAVDFDKKVLSVESFDKKLLDYVITELPFEEISIIPPNRANKLYKKAKIKTYAQGWVKLKKPTFRSVSDEDVYIIGDAQGEYPYPKSAQMANSQALIVANELVNRIKDLQFNYKDNMPANVCYSVITNAKAASITHFYEYKEKIEVSSVTSEISQDTFIAAKSWYKGLTDDIFGL